MARKFAASCSRRGGPSSGRYNAVWTSGMHEVVVREAAMARSMRNLQPVVGGHVRLTSRNRSGTAGPRPRIPRRTRPANARNFENSCASRASGRRAPRPFARTAAPRARRTSVRHRPLERRADAGRATRPWPAPPAPSGHATRAFGDCRFGRQIDASPCSGPSSRASIPVAVGLARASQCPGPAPDETMSIPADKPRCIGQAGSECLRYSCSGSRFPSWADLHACEREIGRTLLPECRAQ